jgi:hypothetical protein
MEKCVVVRKTETGDTFDHHGAHGILEFLDN